MPGEPGLWGDGSEGGEAPEVEAVVGVRHAKWAGQRSPVADDEVADEGRTEPRHEEAEGARRVAWSRDGHDTGKHFRLRVDGAVDGDGLRAGDDERAEEARDVGSADGRTEFVVTVAEAAIAATGDHEGARRFPEGGRAAGVVEVPVGDEDRGERPFEVVELPEDGRSALAEARIDECEGAVVRLDEVDVGAAGGVEPPHAVEEGVGSGDRHGRMVLERGKRRPRGEGAVRVGEGVMVAGAGFEPATFGL